MRRTIAILVLITIVTWISILISDSFDNTIIKIKPSDKSNIIIVTTPINNAEISSPLSIAGRARGEWFSEGSFPTVLVDSYGNIIAEGHVSAQGEWTTKDFVKFVGSLQFNNYIKGSKGKLILKKDNPSGLPENDDSTEIPITFK